MFREPIVRFGGNLLRGTRAGQIFVSADEGQTWQSAVNFGEAFQVSNLLADGDLVYAELSFQNQFFELKSGDGRT